MVVVVFLLLLLLLLLLHYSIQPHWLWRPLPLLPFYPYPCLSFDYSSHDSGGPTYRVICCCWQATWTCRYAPVGIGGWVGRSVKEKKGLGGWGKARPGSGQGVCWPCPAVIGSGKRGMWGVVRVPPGPCKKKEREMDGGLGLTCRAARAQSLWGKPGVHRHPQEENVASDALPLLTPSD